MSEDRGELARWREALFSLAEEAVPREDCPDQERLFFGARGELSPGELATVLDHLVSCPVCVEAWRLAHRLEQGGAGSLSHRGLSEAVPAADRGPRRLSRARWIGPIAAAAVLLLVIGGGWWNRQEAPPAPIEREIAGRRISSLMDEEPVSRARCLLRWSGPEDARYQVEILTENLERVASSSRLEASQYLVPASALASLPPGSRLLWQVRADLPDGRQLRSDTFFLRLE